MNTRAAAAAGVVNDAHRAAVETTTADVVEYLQDTIGRALTAHVAGAHAKTVDRWRRGETPRTEAERRLRFTYQVLRLLMSEDSPHTVRAWLIGLNPQLGDVAPADAIREGKLQDVMIAAHAFRSGG